MAVMLGCDLTAEDEANARAFGFGSVEGHE